MIIPQSALSSDALRGIITEFVLREGTEYGPADVPLETKIKQVERQLDRGDIVIVFDEATEGVDLVPKNSSRYREMVIASTSS